MKTWLKRLLARKHGRLWALVLAFVALGGVEGLAWIGVGIYGYLRLTHRPVETRPTTTTSAPAQLSEDLPSIYTGLSGEAAR